MHHSQAHPQNERFWSPGCFAGIDYASEWVDEGSRPLNPASLLLTGSYRGCQCLGSGGGRNSCCAGRGVCISNEQSVAQVFFRPCSLASIWLENSPTVQREVLNGGLHLLGQVSSLEPRTAPHDHCRGDHSGSCIGYPGHLEGAPRYHGTFLHQSPKFLGRLLEHSVHNLKERIPQVTIITPQEGLMVRHPKLETGRGINLASKQVQSLGLFILSDGTG